MDICKKKYAIQIITVFLSEEVSRSKRWPSLRTSQQSAFETMFSSGRKSLKASCDREVIGAPLDLVKLEKSPHFLT